MNNSVKEFKPQGQSADLDLPLLIQSVATNKDVDVEKMKAILDMQERVLNRQAEQEFYAALNACQRGMTRIATDATNAQTRSRYATYAALDRALRPIYTAQGLSISYDTEPSQRDEHINVVAHVSHPSGFTRRYSVDMPTDGKGAKGNSVMTSTHATGAAMSYGMRYLLKMIFNVAVGEDDTDGNLAGEDVTDWISTFDACASLDDLKKTFTEAWNSVKTQDGRRQITVAKETKKRMLGGGK